MNKADEIKIELRDYRALPDYIEKFPNKTIILDFNKDVPEDFNWEMLKVYSEKLNGNFYCAASNDFQMGIFKRLGIKFYYRYSVSSFYEVDALKE